MAGLLENIRVGKYDASLDRIIDACRSRKENRIYSLKPGDKVKFSDSVRPEYLRGVESTIISWRRTKVLIQMDPSANYAGRFLRGGGRIIAHPSGLIPVED
jgi:hypothetical protein